MTNALAKSTRPRHLVAKLLEQPDLVRLVQGLEAPVLTRLIHHIGLEDAGEIVALATTEQLKGIFDEDLWRSERPGKDEAFDADRFALWLEVMLEAGEAFAARKIAELDEDLVTLALCKHVLVIDIDGLSVQMSSSERSDDDDLVEKALESCLYQEFEEFRVIAKDHRSWDSILLVLVELDREHHALLRALLERCCAISTEVIEESGGLYDVLTSEEMLESDVAADREDRREQEGFVAPSAAVSFLNLARVTPLDEILGARAYDAVTRAHFRAAAAKARPPAAAPRRPVSGEEKGAPAAEDLQSFLEVLREADIVAPAADARLLTAGERREGEDLLFTSAIREVMARDAELYGKRLLELSYLVNVLISGCSHDGRAFRPFEAAEAVLCTCSLGLERLLGERAGRKRPGPDELASAMTEHDAVKMFMAGWNLLHHEVLLQAAGALRKALAGLIADQPDAQAARAIERVAAGLAADVDAGKPWRSRGKLDRIERALGAEATAAYRALLDELPTLPDSAVEAARASGAQRSRFVSSAAQIRAIQAMLTRPEGSGATAAPRAAGPAGRGAKAAPRAAGAAAPAKARKRAQPGAGRRK
ncbi:MULTISPECIES: DUF6178 family protein [Sorangium]|uniref:Uncharacterized protein n=1 Tax=Sorangium cellulosum TaxID=56 RepID=A0A4P2QU18_SORCE|nr:MULTISPECIES: DUF6178 family protein [Sorangium]AUX33854.1 hypothetical protein SOCE836_060180 [Sorangium cellulosum]WCQ93162.1 hypothetical protein NQZ70_05910 [Sorangium sp. Soce836]